MIITYCKQLIGFGKPISKFQNTRFNIVDSNRDEASCTILDKLMVEHMGGGTWSSTFPWISP